METCEVVCNRGIILITLEESNEAKLVQDAQDTLCDYVLDCEEKGCWALKHGITDARMVLGSFISDALMLMEHVEKIDIPE